MWNRGNKGKSIMTKACWWLMHSVMLGDVLLVLRQWLTIVSSNFRYSTLVPMRAQRLF